MIKALFFDIDGTLISFTTHKVPASTIDALKQAKQKGVKIFISTGRPVPLICNLEEVLPMVDGFVTTNGAYCYIGEETINCNLIEPAVVASVIDHVNEYGVACAVVGKKHIAVINEDDKFNYIFRQMLRISIADDTIVSLEDVLNEGVLQMTPFLDAAHEQIAMTGLSCTIGRWHPDFIDITAGGIDKAYGLEKVAAYLGFPIEETMAFGDGGNDLPIIVRAGVGVAMGNAGEEVKAQADYVTTHIDEDGVYHAMKKFGVI